MLDFIIKRGSERVAQQCKEQIYSLLTLQDFRFVDKDGKDQGASGMTSFYLATGFLFILIRMLS